MDRKFRIETFNQILKSAGIVTDLVQKSLSNKISYRTLGSVGKGTTIMMPDNPVKQDGSVDIIIQIRGIAGGDTKTASSLGANAVIVTAEAGGLGSKENVVSFGHPAFINEAVGKVLSALKKSFPDKPIHLGKLTVSSFSGGGAATAALISQRNELPKGSEPPKFVFMDGLHSDPGSKVLDSVIDYAKQVKDDPNSGELAILHSAVVPGKYHSTTDVADYILKQVGVERKSLNYSTEDGVQPVAAAKAGGLSVIQLYDKEQPYMVRDQNGQMKPNVPGTSGYQHINALHWGLQNLLNS